MKSVKAICQILFFCTLPLIVACKKNSTRKIDVSNEKTTKLFSDYLQDNISRDYYGTIKDKDNKALENVFVTVGSKTTSTNSKGIFTINNTSVNSNSVYLNAKKQGYKEQNLSITQNNEPDSIHVQLHNEDELCLFWFCKHNHNLPNPDN